MGPTIENQMSKIQTQNQFSHSQHFSAALKLLLPVSVLSIILSYHISAYTLQLRFSFTTDKNYMFLLCNGILVIIATSSGLIGKLSLEMETDYKAEQPVQSCGYNQRRVPESSEMKSQVAENMAVVEEVKEAKETKMEPLALVAAGDNVLKNEDGGKEQVNELSIYEDEYENEDEDEEGLMSKEELKKKCEEFIRKMRGIN